MTTIQRGLPMVQPETRTVRPLAARAATVVLGGALYLVLWLFGRIHGAAAARAGSSGRKTARRED